MPSSPNADGARAPAVRSWTTLPVHYESKATMNELFTSDLLQRYPEFYFGLGLWAAAVLLVVGAAAGLVPIKRQRTVVLVTTLAVAAWWAAIAFSPSSSLIAIDLMVASIPSAVV